MKYNKIFLLGFRGSGKSAIGKIVADKLNWSFMDMDFLIAQQAGQDINALTKNGTDWKKFREMENDILYELSKMENVVISCGGGVGVNDTLIGNKTYGSLNKEILDNVENSLKVLLFAQEKIIRERIKGGERKNKNKRPLLNEEKAKSVNQNTDRITAVVEDSMEAFNKRKSLYEALTDFKVDSGSVGFEKAAGEIMKEIKDEK